MEIEKAEMKVLMMEKYVAENDEMIEVMNDRIRNLEVENEDIKKIHS
jgi:hypothetical protein